ncbi:MAG: hypothetical protein AAFV77_12170, partial [Planctomycetota bacterium]
MCSNVARRIKTGSASVLALLLTVVSPAPVFAQGADFIANVNERSQTIPQDQRADVVLFPALVDLEAPPASVSELEDGRPTDAMLLGPGLRGWT